ncbi:MAG: DNA gyrase C-terminal beta-propeller domain-containing protein, partial [Gemmatimonadota bacterium]
ETRSSRGRALSEFVALAADDRVVSATPVGEWKDRFLVTVTRKGQVKRTELAEYANARAGGIIGAGLSGDDEVVAALVTDGSAELVLATRAGKAIRFAEREIRPMGRSARGVRGIDMPEGDEVVAAEAPRRDASFCLATTLGYGKRLPLTELRLQSRAGKGVRVLPDREKAGDLVGFVELRGDDRLMWELDSGELLASDGNRLQPRSRRAATVRILKGLKGEAVVRALHVAAGGRNAGEDDSIAEDASVAQDASVAKDTSVAEDVQAELELAPDR